MHKRLILLLLLIILVKNVNSQQDPLLTHFIYNKMAFNPGSTGLDEGFNATTAYRNQWDKVDGAPNSAILNIEGNMNRFFPGGLGLNFYHDAIGFNRQNNLMLNYSYPISIGQDLLSAGIGIGMTNFGMKPTWVTPDQSSNGTADKSLPIGFSSTGLDLNLGLYYKSTKRFYVGLSMTHLTASNLKNKSDATQTFKVARHAYIMAGYKTKLIGPGALDFQMILRTDLHKASFDLNTRYILEKIGYIGLTYRTTDAVAIMLGFIPVKNLTVGYSYDLTLSKLTSVSRGSHEVLLKYCYFLPIPPVSVSRHPRWL